MVSNAPPPYLSILYRNISCNCPSRGSNFGILVPDINDDGGIPILEKGWGPKFGLLLLKSGRLERGSNFSFDMGGGGLNGDQKGFGSCIWPGSLIGIGNLLLIVLGEPMIGGCWENRL